MKMKDAIKLGIGFYIGKEIAGALDAHCESACIKVIGKLQDVSLSCLNDYDRKLIFDKYCGGGKSYFGTKYKKSTVTNKKNPIGFV